MAPESARRASVLIIEGDAAIRGLIGAVLEHAGFRTWAAEDLQEASTLLETSTYDVIVHDLNLAPAECERGVQRLAAMAPELLRRTIVTTTAPARAAAAMGTVGVFAVVGKPFELESLLEAVRACARSSRELDGRGRSRPRASRKPRQSDVDTDGSMELDSLQRFVRTAPSLQRLLSVPVGSGREAVLRAQMRRTIAVLSATLKEASQGEASSTRAAVLRAAAVVAARLAIAPAQRRTLMASRGMDH